MPELFSTCLKPQEKLKRMLMQNFGGTKKGIMLNLKVADSNSSKYKCYERKDPRNDFVAH